MAPYKGEERNAFILGMITAFSEVLAYEVKKLALSPPLRPEDYASIQEEAERIAAEQGILLYHDENKDIPEKNRLTWLVMVKFPEPLEAYKALREEGFNPAWHFEKFFDLLSYGMAWAEGVDRVVPRIREHKTHDGLGTMARILFEPGEWPPPAA